MTGGALVSQYTVGDRIPGVANYAQEIKSFNDCGYKAPAITVAQSGLPGFSGAAAGGLFSGLKFWGGKRRTGRKTMKKRGGANASKSVFKNAKNALMGLFTQATNAPLQPTNAPVQPTNVNMEPEPMNMPAAPMNMPAAPMNMPAAPVNMPAAPMNMPINVISTNGQTGGGGGMAYGTAFEMGGVNPLTIQTRLGCESGAGQTQAAQPSFFGKLFSGGGRRRMRGGSADYASAFDIMARQPSNLVLTSPYSGQGVVYEAPRAGFGVESSGSTGVPPFEIYKGYDASKALSGPCTQKGGKKSKKSKKGKKAKKSKRTRKH